MSNDTPNNPPKQMALFPFMSDVQKNDKRSLPLIVAENWQFPLQHHDVSGAPYFSVQDWIAGITNTQNPRDILNKLKTRLERKGIQLSNSLLQLPYTAKNGKTYQMDYANDVTLYQIAQYVDVNTVLRDKVLIYLARAGAKLDKLRIDGTLDQIKEAARNKGIESRNRLTDAATETHEFGKPQYASLTNTNYHVLFRTKEARTAKAELVAILGLDDKQAKKFRDHIHHLALNALSAAESASATKMHAMGRLLTDAEQIEIVKYCARIVAPTFQHLAQYAGVDLLTGKPLLEA